MASDSEPRRVEVELTPTGADSKRPPTRSDHGGEHIDPQPGDAAHRDDGASILTSGDPESTGVPPRTIVVGAVAAILGLAGGWLLGNTAGSGSGTADDVEVATATTAVTSGSGDPESTLEPIDTVRRTTTTRPQRTVTTITLPGPQVAPVALHPALSGAEFRLVGVSGANTTAEIDFGAATITARNWGAVDLEPSAALIGEGWILSPNPQTGRVTVVTGDGDRSTPELGDAWSLLPIDGGDRFWRPIDFSFGPNVEFEEVDRSGDPTGPRIDTAGVWPVGVDPATDGILTVVQGSTYSIGPDRQTLIGEGDVVAVSATHAVLTRCDAALACRFVLVDRATDQERTIPGGGEPLPVVPFGFFPLRSELSPDGSTLAFATWSDNERPTLSVIDTETGAMLPLSDRADGAPAWSPDGRFGFFVEGSTLKFYDRVTGEIDEVGDEVGTWRSVDVRAPVG